MGDTIYSKQLAFLVFMLLLGSALIYVPEASTGRNAWLSTILAAGAGLLVLTIIIKLQLMFPGTSIFKISELALGKIPGKFLNAVYLWMVLLVATTYLYDSISFLRIIFPFMPFLSLRALLLLTAAYCLYKGIGSLGHLAELLIGPVIFFFLLGLLAPLNLMDFGHLKPVLAEWKPALAGIVYGANWPYAEVSILALLLPFTSDLKEEKRFIYYWFVAGLVALFLRTLVVLTVLGPDQVGILRFPLYEVFRLVSVQNFQRVELFFFILWFSTGFMAILIYYQGLVLGLKELFSLSGYRILILPSGLGILVLSAYMIRTDIEFLSVESMVLPFHDLPIHILYPALVYLLARIRQKSIKETLQVESDQAHNRMQVSQ
ncbi:GerAB/ArcD/ProY family transporter [Syntrophomonas erecta]